MTVLANDESSKDKWSIRWTICHISRLYSPILHCTADCLTTPQTWWHSFHFAYWTDHLAIISVCFFRVLSFNLALSFILSLISLLWTGRRLFHYTNINKLFQTDLVSLRCARLSSEGMRLLWTKQDIELVLDTVVNGALDHWSSFIGQTTAIISWRFRTEHTGDHCHCHAGEDRSDDTHRHPDRPAKESRVWFRWETAVPASARRS